MKRTNKQISNTNKSKQIMKRLSAAIITLLIMVSGLSAQDLLKDTGDGYEVVEEGLEIVQSERPQLQAKAPGFETITPFQSIWDQTPWPSTEVNFPPSGQNLPAGDLNGDGTTDLFRNYINVADEQSEDLGATTDKTLLYWGGSDISTTADLVIKADLQPVGNLYDKGNDNAIAYDDEEGQWYIYSFTDSDFEREVLDDAFFDEDYSTHNITLNDLNGDGYDDIVVVDRGTNLLHILYGGETLEDLNAETQDLREWANNEQFNLTRITLNDVYSHEGNSYIIMRSIDQQVDENRRAIIASINDAGEPEMEQSFILSDNTDISSEILKAITVHPDEAPYLFWVTPDQTLTQIFDASEAQDQLFETNPRIWVELPLKPISDIDNDGRTDFIVEEIGGDVRYMYGPQEADGRPEFGDEVISESNLDPVFNLQETNLSANETAYGDLTGNGVNDYFITTNSEDQFGQVLVEGSEDRSFETTELLYNVADYQRTVRNDTYPLGDITGNGLDDFAVNVVEGETHTIEVYEGGNLSTPHTSIETDYIDIIDISAGVFSESGRTDIAIMGRYNDTDDGRDVIASEVVLHAGGSTIESSPYLTITDHDAHPGFDYLDNALHTLATAGDINNDGLDDLLIGAPTSTDYDDGSIFPTVLYEGGPDMGGEPDHQVLYTDGIFGQNSTGFWFGNSMSAVGDVNGDGIDDFAIASTDSYWDEERLAAGQIGVVHVYFGSDEEDHSFEESDVVLKTNLEDAQDNIRQQYLGFSEIAAGDYNGDGNNDIAVKTLNHLNNETGEGAPGIHIYNGGPDMDGEVDNMVGLFNDVMSITEIQSTYASYMGHALMQTVPDIDGSGHDELLVIGDNGYTNGVLLMGSDDSIQKEPEAVLEAPNQAVGMGSEGNFINRHYKTAMGDFTGDGFQDVAVVQRNDDNYRDTPVHLFSTGDASVAATFDFQAELSVEDNAGNNIGLTFGTSADARTGIDELDQEAPPLPPAGSFDARLVQQGTGFFTVYHEPTEELNEWTIVVQPKEGESPVTLSWDTDALAEDGAFSLSSNNGAVNVDMREETSVTLTESDPDTLNISHGIAEEVPAAVVLVDPTDGADLEADSLTFVWEQSEPAVQRYGIEIARDAEFSDMVVDSVVNDTSFVFKDADEEAELYWRVRAENDAGWGDYSVERSLNWIPTSIEPQAGIPDEFALENNYPNPFNPSTVIGYQLPDNSRVQVEVFDVLGKKVATLVNTRQQAGTYEVNFDASNLSSGVYIYRIQAGEFSQTKQMVLIK